ncbi:hypothetical protein [Vandammella animalimorsus]|uniref:hypothetical protein n=1 Tax=Vandammella animalimorsus TaxID=2029117 RepID=UPI0011778A3C|nr:hypothetical protein [Vandammella animalimorsus]
MDPIDFLHCADIHLNEFINSKRRIIDQTKDIISNIKKYTELINENDDNHKDSIDECKRIHSRLIIEHNRSVLNLTIGIDLTSELIDFYRNTSITKVPNADDINKFIKQKNIDIIHDNVDELHEKITKLRNFIDEEYNRIYSEGDLSGPQQISCI